MKPTLVTIFLLLQLVCFSQENKSEENNLKGQFDKIYRTSTTYQTYKVIKIDKYIQLKENVLDSIKEINKEISEKDLLLKTERKNVNALNIELSNIKKELEDTLKKENSISFFGIQLSKTSYNIILWSIILSLSIGLSFFIFKFSRSNVLTKKAQENLIEVEKEFEQHRKKSLNREQKLRRELQDEINKQRNS